MFDQAYPFPHQRLDVYRVALQLAQQSKGLADRIPRGYRSFADQLIRSAGSTLLLIGEGAEQFAQRCSQSSGHSHRLMRTITCTLVSARAKPCLKEDDQPWIKTDPKGMVAVLVLRRLAYNVLALFRSVTQRSEERRHS